MLPLDPGCAAHHPRLFLLPLHPSGQYQRVSQDHPSSCAINPEQEFAAIHLFPSFSLALSIIAARRSSTPRQVPGNKLPTPPGESGHRSQALPLCPSSQHRSLLPIHPPSHCALTATRHCKHQWPPLPPLPFPSPPGTRPSGAQGNGQGERPSGPHGRAEASTGQLRGFAAALRPVAEPLVNPPPGLTAAALTGLEEEKGRASEREIAQKTRNCAAQARRVWLPFSSFTASLPHPRGEGGATSG